MGCLWVFGVRIIQIGRQLADNPRHPQNAPAAYPPPGKLADKPGKLADKLADKPGKLADKLADTPRRILWAWFSGFQTPRRRSSTGRRSAPAPPLRGASDPPRRHPAPIPRARPREHPANTPRPSPIQTPQTPRAGFSGPGSVASRPRAAGHRLAAAAPPRRRMISQHF